LDGLKNLMLSEIEIGTDSLFKREIEVNGRFYPLYNLVFGEERYRRLTIPMDGYQCLPDRLELQIRNGDDDPIQVDSVRVSYFACDMVFPNRDAPAALYFGDDDVIAPPQYDIASYKEHILAAGYSKGAIGEIAPQPAGTPESAPAFDYTKLFNVTIIAASVLLAALLLTRLKKAG
jgi:hypothetical protein